MGCKKPNTRDRIYKAVIEFSSSHLIEDAFSSGPWPTAKVCVRLMIWLWLFWLPVSQSSSSLPPLIVTLWEVFDMCGICGNSAALCTLFPPLALTLRRFALLFLEVLYPKVSLTDWPRRRMSSACIKPDCRPSSSGCRLRQQVDKICRPWMICVMIIIGQIVKVAWTSLDRYWILFKNTSLVIIAAIGLKEWWVLR